MPGMVGHASDFIEHPALVAERMIRYAGLVVATISSREPIAD
jgi:hypothetical protein